MSDESSKPERPPPSYGNLDEHHWSRTRGERNREALDYYRERSKAAGVESGGAERNFYCMKCDGVIAFDFRGERCPHCDAELDEHVKRYFNWVEINETPKGDARAVLPLILGALAVLTLAAFGLYRWLS